MAMNKLIGNLKTYEMLKNFEKLKVEPKAEKNLVLKATKETTTDENKETVSIVKRVLKALIKSRALPKGGDTSRVLRKEKKVTHVTNVASLVTILEIDILLR